MRFSTLVSGLAWATLALSKPAPRCSISSCCETSSKYLTKVAEQFATDGIIPDLIERIKPKVRVRISYGAKKVQLGTYFTTLQTTPAPTISFTAEPGYNPATTRYTLFMIDPDVPQDGSMVQVNFAHWMVIHLQPKCIKNQSPEEVIAYELPTPLSTTQHRYTFLLYREPKGYNPSPASQIRLNIRTPFDLNNYVQDSGLVLVGGNFFKEAIDNGLQGKM